MSRRTFAGSSGPYDIVERIAQNMVYHDAARPSPVVLPILEKRAES